MLQALTALELSTTQARPLQRVMKEMPRKSPRIPPTSATMEDGPNRSCSSYTLVKRDWESRMCWMRLAHLG